MGTAVVMVTVASRVQMLNGFLATLAEFEPGRDVLIHVQGDYAAWREQLVMPRGLEWAVMSSPEPLGCHAARVMLLQQDMAQGFDHYVNVDDDVYLLPQTHWQPAIDKTNEPGVGFVLTNWVRHPNMLAKRIETMEDKFYKQVMVYQGGGMAYTDEVADLMRALPTVHARYDDLWPLTVYLNGYQSYRYQGSLAVHTIMGKGGMNTYMRSEPRPLLCWEWINYKPLYGQPVGSDYSIPMDRELRPNAKAAHKAARARRGWL
jgi:hypothetical protein